MGKRSEHFRIKIDDTVDFINNDALCIITDNRILNKTKNVWRSKKDGRIYLIDEQNNEFLCSIERIEKNSITLKKIEGTRTFSPSEKSVNLFIAALPINKMRLVVSAAVELNVHSIQIFRSRFSKVNINKLNILRLKEIARNATEQCKRLDIPEIKIVNNFNEALISAQNIGTVLFFHQDARNKFDASVELTDKLSVFVGPEGGFSENEIEFALSQEIIPYRFFDTTLRSEFFAISALAAINWGQTSTIDKRRSFKFKV